jgi:tetratricopeptide (TPR) repeat protein
LRIVLAQYPRDRVALNDLGRILFLQRKYSEAVKTLQSVLAIDPEDLQAHYNLMLCYNGLGNEKLAKEHEARYMRFKADESSQAITGPYRQLHPEDNNERQTIHEHISVHLPVVTATHVGTAASAVLPGNARPASTAAAGGSR